MCLTGNSKTVHVLCTADVLRWKRLSEHNVRNGGMALLLAAETTETQAKLGINCGNSYLNQNELKIQRTLYKNDNLIAVLKQQNNRHFGLVLLRLMETVSCLQWKREKKNVVFITDWSTVHTFIDKCSNWSTDNRINAGC